MAVVPTKAGPERPLSGGAPRFAAAEPLRCGALKLPRLRSRLTHHLSRRATSASSTIARAVVVGGVLALVLAGGLAHFRPIAVDQPERL